MLYQSQDATREVVLPICSYTGTAFVSVLYISLWFFHSFPASWIKGDKYPKGIPYNSKLSKLDKKLVRKFYGEPRSSNTKADLETPVDSTK